MEADPQRLQTQTALHEQGTIFEITLIILSAPTDVDDLMRRAVRTVVERHRYESFAIYLAQSDSDNLRLAGGEPTGTFPRDADQSLAERATVGSRPVRERVGDSWLIAVPIASDSSTLGAIVVGSDAHGATADHALAMCGARAAQLALGIQNINLRRRQLELAADEERARIAHEIHDGVAQSMYALNLGIENCARLAERENYSTLNASLTNLIPLSRQTLLEIRHYMYDLTPLLSVKDSFEDLMKKQVGEFEAISQIPTHVEMRGGDRKMSVPVRAGMYRILHEALSNVLKHSRASEVRIEIQVDSVSACMSVKDAGAGFDMGEARAGFGLGGMRRRAEDLGGTLTITSAEGIGTGVRVCLPLKDQSRGSVGSAE